MKQPQQFSLFFLLLILNFLFPGCAHGTFVTFYINNKCPFPIWPATAANAGHPVIAEGGFFLPSSQTKRIVAPYTWSGRIWARTGCDFNSGSKPACETGDCEGRLACGGSIGLPPVTLVQVSVQPNDSQPTFYDVSLVDGYNLPVSVSTRSKESNCFIGGCSKNLNSLCPQELQVTNNHGKVVACKSACLAFNLDMFCCRNNYGSPDKCNPNAYSKMFKNACPSYFSYAFDTPTPLVSCKSTEYVITFCPSKWGEHTSI
ncbi:Thaumatin-like protein [Thalictrum thalictroides]|uniref:Thaumatin-like protein n=1 Tax=Thalictrum thalictroides TaxID=46969 RepID=A0A7J6W0L2_THATH|nr:Thaumatin-like protein [Thalictrum thalictroides]